MMYIETYRQFKSRQVLSPKEKLRQWIRDGLLGVLAALPSGDSGNFVRCLYCHYVFDDQKESFREIIETLKGMGEFISTAELSDFLDGTREIDGKYFHLSFDDAFRNTYINAIDTLVELDVKAIFFVPSQFVEVDYDSTCHYCIDITKYPGPMELLKWKDVEELMDLDFEIGSHTRTHANLNLTDTEVLRSEILYSKHDIEDRLGIECKYISWPYGRYTDISPVALELVEESGYKLCFAAERGQVEAGTNRLSIPRHHFEPFWPIGHIRYFLNGNFEK